MKKILLSVFAMFMVISLAACGKSNETTENSDTPKSIKIGGSGPLTGKNAVYGENVRDAFMLAVEEINEKEGYAFF